MATARPIQGSRNSTAIVESQLISPAVQFASVSSITIPPMNMSFLIEIDHSNFLLWWEQLLSLISANVMEKINDPSIPVPTIVIPDTQILNPKFEN